MDASLVWLWEHIEKISVVFLVLLCALSLFRGWVVTYREHDRMIAEKDRMWEKAVKDCEFQRTMNERLLAQIERTVTVAEAVTRNRA